MQAKEHPSSPHLPQSANINLQKQEINELKRKNIC